MPDNDYQRRFGDRKDGRLLRSLPPSARLAPYLIPDRAAAQDLYADTADAGPAEDWLAMARIAGHEGIGFLHVFLAAYVRAVARCPGLNRFVAGQKIYARNRIEVVLPVRRALANDAGETAAKVLLDPADTVYDVCRKVGEAVDAVNAGEDRGRPAALAEGFMNLPGPLLKFVLWFLRLLDYFDLLPRSLRDASPFHGSVRVDDLGALDVPPCWRHLGALGSLPLAFTLGAARDGRIDYRAAADSRVTDGAYRAAALKYLKYYLEHPAALETPPEQVFDDVM